MVHVFNSFQDACCLRVKTHKGGILFNICGVHTSDRIKVRVKAHYTIHKMLSCAR